MSAQHTNQEIGRLGEKLAAKHLRRHGYRILKKNLHCGKNELDLIAKNKQFLVFVEVKLRKTAAFAEAMEYVDKRKQDRLRTTASMYLSANPTELQPRFDVIEIYAPEGPATARPEIRHMEDAFQ